MTALEDRPVTGTAPDDADVDVPLGPQTPGGGDPPPVDDGGSGDGGPSGDPTGDGAVDDEAPPPLTAVIRPVLAGGLATCAAGLVAGGIFGSWPARLTGVAGAAIGAGWALATVRSRRPTTWQAAFPVAVVVLAALSLIPRGEAPSRVFALIGDAVAAGRLFRPPVPYDPGWTPLLVGMTAFIGYAAAWVGAGLGRPRLAVALPLPVVAFTMITQPDDGQFIAGVGALVPLLAALGVLYGGDTDRASQLSGDFEVKRAVRGLIALVPGVGLLVALGNASFLFPEPVYDPTEQPQKPRAVPLSEARDRVLFEVVTDADITGPWRAGVLDVYDPEDHFWKAPPRDLGDFPDGFVLSPHRLDAPQLTVTIITRDLGNSAVFPTLAGVTRLDFAGGPPDGARFDARTELVRMASGRVPADVTYTMRLPAYPTEAQFEAAPALADRTAFADQLAIGDPPPRVRALLADAPPEPWARLDFLRSKLLSNVVAAGGGVPVEIPPERVDEMLTPPEELPPDEDGEPPDGPEATPYEIVAAEAMLARWAGVPSRIGFGFDGLNIEDGLATVRPRNSAQWLEVYFEGIGWTPLIGSPQQARSSLDPAEARFNPTVLPSDDVAVEVYIPFELEDLTQLYQRIRNQIIRWSPLVALGLTGWITWPFFAKIHRRAKRRRWAAARGPRAQIAVEYAEFRDLATDLNVADIYSTPLEYLFEVVDDDEHAEFAWLVARALYGDLADAVTTEDVLAAESMGASLRRRLARAQPLQVQALAYLSRASLRQPYSTEVPNIVLPRLPRLPRPRSAVGRLRGRVRRPALVPGGRR